MTVETSSIQVNLLQTEQNDGQIWQHVTSSQLQLTFGQFLSIHRDYPSSSLQHQYGQMDWFLVNQIQVQKLLKSSVLHIVIFLTKLYKDEFFRFKGVNWIELTMWPTMSVLFILLSFKFWRSAVRSFLFSVKGITCLECIFVKTYFQG